MQTKKTAPFDVANDTQQDLCPFTSIITFIYKMPESLCALACPAGGASGRAWFFWFFLHQGKKNIILQQEIKGKELYVLSFACAKERTKPACRQAGKSTPAMIYSHCRTPWLNFSATVNCTKQFLSSTSTINEICFLIRSLVKLKGKRKANLA